MRIDITSEIERRLTIAAAGKLVTEFWHKDELVGYTTPQGLYWVDLSYGATALEPVDANSDDPEAALSTLKFWKEDLVSR